MGDDKTRHFASTVSTVLAGRGMSQTALAQAVGSSAAYVNHLMTGYRRPTANWADLVANALGVDEDTRTALHKAAAKDLGFKLD